MSFHLENLYFAHTQLKESITSLQHQIDFERNFLKDRRKRILDERERQKQLIENTETLIADGRKYREMTSGKVNWELTKMPQLPSTPDLMRLREKLAHVRCRTSNAKCSR